jgi:hypothetical protein
MYSTNKSIHIGNPGKAVTAAASRMPVASRATQWTVDPTPCFQQLDEVFVAARLRIFFCRDVQQEADRTQI